MTTFGYVFLAGSIVAVLMGILLVGYTLFSLHGLKKGARSSSQIVDLKLFGVEIRSGSLFAIFVIGVALVIFPLKFSVDLLTLSPGHQPGLSIVPGPGKFIEVAEAGEPNMEGFRILKDVRLVDLRSRVPIPESKKNQEYSPVTWTRYTLLKKLSPAKEFIDFEFGTTGVKVSPRSLTHEFQLRKLTKPHSHGATKLRHTWQIRVDVKNVKTNEDFLVINEVTYWNGFSGEEKEWAAMPVEENTDLIAMILLFPEKKPFKGYDLWYSPRHTSQELKPFRDPSVVIPAENHQVLLWHIDKPIKGHQYQIDWTW